MADEAPVALPSLDIVRAEVDAVIAEQDRRGSSFDSKAGFLLGISGVLIGLASRHADALRIAGQLAAAVAAAAAIAAMVARTTAGLDLRAIRNGYLTTEVVVAKQRLLDTRIHLYERDEERLSRKVRWIKVSVMLLAVAVALLVTGTIADVWLGEAR